MKRNEKLGLKKITLKNLDERSLLEVAGGATTPVTACPRATCLEATCLQHPITNACMCVSYDTCS
jgi:hypothetical protein